MRKSESSFDIYTNTDENYGKSIDGEWPASCSISNMSFYTEVDNYSSSGIESEADSEISLSETVIYACSFCEKLMDKVNDWYSASCKDEIRDTVYKQYHCSMQCLWNNTHDSKRIFSSRSSIYKHANPAPAESPPNSVLDGIMTDIFSDKASV